MTAPHLGPGHTVAGKYTIRALLGFTGEKATYHATASGGHEVVIKLFDPAIGQRADVMGQLERVRAQVAALPPASVVGVFDAGYDVGTSAPFIVTEYLQVPSLSRLVDTGPLSPEVVGRIMLGLAQILDAAHRTGLFHLALKPTNVFVGPAPHYPVRVTDFGASVVRSTNPTHEAYAQSAPWWAPEQLQPAAVLGVATDVFASALVAFYALTGRSYWISCQHAPPDLPAWQMEVMGQRVPVSQRARELGSVVNPIIDGLMARALSVNQPDRPQTVIELANALGSAGGFGPRDQPKTVAFPAIADGAAGGGGYAPAPGGQYPPQPYGAGGVPATDGQYTAMAGARRPASSSQNLTAGLPPFPQPQKKKSGSSMLPVIIGVAAAVIIGGGVITLLFMRGDPETGPTAVATGSSKPTVPDDEGEGGSAPATTSVASASVEDPPRGEGGGGVGGASATDGKTVAVTIKCVPECDEIWVDNEKQSDASGKLELLPGRHTIKAMKEGFYPKMANIVVLEDKPLTEEYALAPVVSSKLPPTKGKGKQPCGQFLKPCK